MLLADSQNGTHVFHRDRLAAARVVGYGEHDQGYPIGPHASNQLLECDHVHVTFEGV